MAITNKQSGTNVHEIADRIYRINTPVVIEGGPGGFSFNQYLIAEKIRGQVLYLAICCPLWYLR